MWYRNLITEYEIKYTHLSIDIEVIFFATVDSTWFDSDFDIEVAIGSAPITSISSPRMSYIDAVFDPSRYIDSKFLFYNF
jgi:hypothetical protein